MQMSLAKIWNSPSARNVGKLISANVIAQAIGLLVYPILTRLYTPEDFGLLSLFTSIGGVLIILACLDWFNAIVLPKDEGEARAVVHISLVAIAGLTLLLCATIPFATTIAGLFKSPRLAHYWWLLPFYVLLMSVWNVLNYWYVRRKAYGRVSGYQISQSLFSAGYKTGFGWFGILRGGLIFSSILSPLCSLVVSLLFAAKQHIKPLLVWDWSRCKAVAERYANFPKFSLPHSLINNIAAQLPVLVLTPLFSVRDVGFWSMALLLSFMPISVVTRALYQVFFQEVSEWVNNRQSIVAFFRRFTLLTLGLVLPFFIGLWFVLPTLTAWLLGGEWTVTGLYIRWLLPWLVCNILCASTGFLYDIFFKQKQGLYFEILVLICRVIGLCIGIGYNSFEMAIAGYALGSALANGIQYIWLMLLVRRYEDSLTNG